MTQRPTAATLLTTAGLAALLAGCSAPQPDATGRADRRAPAPAVPERAERRDPPRSVRPPHVAPARLPGPADRATPERLLRAYVALLTTWDGRTILARERELCGLSAGRLAATLRDAATHRDAARTLTAEGAAARGHVLAVTVTGTGRVRHGTVTFRERLYAGAAGQDSPPYLTRGHALVVWTAGGWRVKAFASRARVDRSGGG